MKTFTLGIAVLLSSTFLVRAAGTVTLTLTNDGSGKIVGPVSAATFATANNLGGVTPTFSSQFNSGGGVTNLGSLGYAFGITNPAISSSVFNGSIETLYSPYSFGAIYTSNATEIYPIYNTGAVGIFDELFSYGGLGYFWSRNVTSNLYTVLDLNLNPAITVSNITDTVNFRGNENVSSNLTVGGTITGNGAGLTNLNGGDLSGILYVSKTGNNATAVSNNPALPWLTIASAMSNAVPGETVWVSPGNYAERWLAKSNVSLYLSAGTTIAGITLAQSNYDGSTAKNTAPPILVMGDGNLVATDGNAAIWWNGVSANLYCECQTAQDTTGNNTAISMSGWSSCNIHVKGRLTSSVIVTWTSPQSGDAIFRFDDYEAAGCYFTGPGTVWFYGQQAPGSMISSLVNGSIPLQALNGFGNSTYGINCFMGVHLHGWGDLFGSSNDELALRTNCVVDWHGNLTSVNSAGVFVQGPGCTARIWGDVQSFPVETSYAGWNLSGSGCAVMNGATGGGNVTIFGNVSGIIPIVNGEGSTTVYGDVIYTNFWQTSLYFILYTSEVAYNNATWIPGDVTNRAGTAVCQVSNGVTRIYGNVSSMTNHAIQISGGGTVEVHDGVITGISTNQSAADYNDKGTVRIDNGTLKLFNASIATGNGDSNCIVTTNSVAVTVQAYGNLATNAPAGTNVSIVFQGASGGSLMMGSNLVVSNTLAVATNNGASVMFIAGATHTGRIGVGGHWFTGETNGVDWFDEPIATATGTMYRYHFITNWTSHSYSYQAMWLDGPCVNHYGTVGATIHVNVGCLTNQTAYTSQGLECVWTFAATNSVQANEVLNQFGYAQVGGWQFSNGAWGGGWIGPWIEPPDGTNNYTYVVEGTVTFNGK